MFNVTAHLVWGHVAREVDSYCCQHMISKCVPCPRLLRSNVLLKCAFVDRFSTWPHTGCASSLYTPKAAVFQVSKPCSGLSFTYPNYLAVFQISKPCNGLSSIPIKPSSSLTLRNQTSLQQPNTFMYPNLAVVFQVSKPYQQHRSVL